MKKTTIFKKACIVRGKSLTLHSVSRLLLKSRRERCARQRYENEMAAVATQLV